jgi:hypothetical protein
VPSLPIPGRPELHPDVPACRQQLRTRGQDEPLGALDVKLEQANLPLAQVTTPVAVGGQLRDGLRADRVRHVGGVHEVPLQVRSAEPQLRGPVPLAKGKPVDDHRAALVMADVTVKQGGHEGIRFDSADLACGAGKVSQVAGEIAEVCPDVEDEIPGVDHGGQGFEFMGPGDAAFQEAGFDAHIGGLEPNGIPPWSDTVIEH